MVLAPAFDGRWNADVEMNFSKGDRKMFRFARSPLLMAALATSLAACAVEDMETGAPQIPTDEAPAADETLRAAMVLDPLFAEAAAAHDVPAPLLKAISYAQTRWQMVTGGEEFEGMPAAHGLMALRGEAVEDAAALIGASEDAVRTDPRTNLMAGAALLSMHADELGIDRGRGDLGAWAPAVAQMSGIELEAAQAQYIHDEVYAVLRQGAVAYTAQDEVAVSLAPAKVEADFPLPVQDKAAGPDYAASIWRPSPNYNSRPTGSIGDPAMIVIHTCEGSYSSCWSWLTNSASGVSAHYVVSENGAEISQLVLEANRAFHVGATYDCSLNGNVDCGKNGYSVNHFSVGIEHGGFASQSSFPVGQIDASAKLSCDISRDQAIPRDRYHIVAHGTLQPYNRTDPGPNWPWTDYLNRINNYCSSGSLIIDSNNNNNDTSKGYIQASANWTSSTNVPGYYGTGYFWASTQAISDGASFWFYLPAAATKTVDAWWTAGTDRSTTAPFIAYNASGTSLGTVNKNQQINGGTWNTIGTFNFSAGWNRVMLSRWTTAGSVVIADAVRIR
jgi:N-acetyl-anhydromuramyl-L-alanine amidase AmpD